MNRRRVILVLVLAGLLATAVAWAYDRMARRRRAAADARQDLTDCRRMADEIERLRRRPARAGKGARASAETIGLIETSAKRAGLTASALLRITPEQAQRVGDTVYLEKPTRVLLKNVTLQELVAMAHAIATDKDRLRCKSMRISAPSVQDTGRLWTVELVLTYLIYSPPGTGR